MNGEAPLKKELIKNSHYIVLMLLHVCCVQNAEAATALPPPLHSNFGCKIHEVMDTFFSGGRPCATLHAWKPVAFAGSLGKAAGHW